MQVCACAFALHQEQKKRDHLGTVAIDVHRMFHRDSTALTTRPSIRPGMDLRWPATYTGNTQELAYNPADPSNPLPEVNSLY